MKKKYLFVSLFAVVVLAAVVWADTHITYFDLPSTGTMTFSNIDLSAGDHYYLQADPDTTLFPNNASTKWSLYDSAWSLYDSADNPVFVSVLIQKPDYTTYNFSVTTSGTYHFSGYCGSNNETRTHLFKTP